MPADDILGAPDFAAGLARPERAMLRYALTNLTRRKARTLYALLGIAVGISVFISVTASTEGIETSFKNLLGKFRGDLIVFRKGPMGINS